MKNVFATLLLCGVLAAQQSYKPVEPQPAGSCCLCECRGHDQSKCSALCIRLQHSKRIIELPEINLCTRSCVRHGVKPMPMEPQQ
jgi:hypothetical protein